MSSLRESRLSINGVAGIVTSAGDSNSEEAVVCLHGVPGSGRDFRRLLPETEKIARSIAFDLPGFGRADKPRDFPYSIEGYQTWLAPALDQLGIQRAHLVLHDFGGPIGLMWAAMNPQKVASIILIDTGVLADYRWHLLGRLWRTPRVGEAVQAGTTRPLFKLWMRRGNIRGLDPQWLDELIDEDERRTRSATLKLYPKTPMTPAAPCWARRLPRNGSRRWSSGAAATPTSHGATPIANAIRSQTQISTSGTTAATGRMSSIRAGQRTQ